MYFAPITVLLRLIVFAAILLTPCAAFAQSAYSPPIWEVRSGERTAYLFGTIHVGKADFYPLPEPVQSAFAQSDVVALEVDPADEQAAVAAAMSAMYTPPDNIGNHLDPDLIASVIEVCAGYGIPFEQIRQIKP